MNTTQFENVLRLINQWLTRQLHHRVHQKDKNFVCLSSQLHFCTYLRVES